MIGSWLAASAVAHDAAAKSERAFLASSAYVAAALKLDIQHEEDLIISAQAFVLGNSNATQTQFVQWANYQSTQTRYPELLGIGEAQIVPARQLSAFVARTTEEFGAATLYSVMPPGRRAFYCLSVLRYNRSAKRSLPLGFDLCAGKGRSGRLASRDTGAPYFAPLQIGDTSTLNLAVPVYRGGVTPPSVSARRGEFIGWVGMNLDPSVIIGTAVSAHPDLAVLLRYGRGASAVTFHYRAVPRGANNTMIDLRDGWIVEAFGSVYGGSIFSNVNALSLLLVGFGLSLLLGAVIYLLGTGRARAMALVNVRTRQLRYQAMHDSLTSLPNRALIIDRMEQMLARARRSQLPVAAMFLDLDDFKDINDTLGHAAGDELIVAVAKRLAGIIREGDTVGRLGGDEFVVLVEGASLSPGVEVVANRILDALVPPFEIPASDMPLPISVSIGVATGERQTPDELLRDADIALYRAKASGKRCVVVFEPSMQTEASDQRHLEIDLHRALESNQFFLLYQPTVSLQTNDFIGVEALLRWRHPVGGVIEPDDFVPALETSGLIFPVGSWVLNEACRQGAVWHDEGFSFSVSVNVSARQLERDRIVDDVRGALLASGFPAEDLILEITETSLMHDIEESIARLGLLKALGVRIAVDDFGTGYSSLAYLRRFPIDILKIDRSFVSGVNESSQSSALVHTLVQLGKVLNLETVAEGVEDDYQRLRLQAEDVDIGQGFLFSRPLDVDSVNRFLRERGRVTQRVDARRHDA